MNIGLFGGTFDPVHNAHLFVAEGSRVALGLERIVFLPTKRGAHRDGAAAANAQDRVAMLRLAIAGNPAFAIDESDLRSDATGFTADVLPLVRSRYPGAELTFIVGADSLLRSRWQRFDDVLDALASFAIVPRAENSVDELGVVRSGLTEERAAKLRVLDLPALTESATLVRRRLARAQTVRYLVPEPVWRYIDERRLYRQAA